MVIFEFLVGGFGSEYTIGRDYLANQAAAAQGKIWYVCWLMGQKR